MRIKEKVYYAIQKSRETDQIVQKNFYLKQMFRAFKRQIRKQIILRSNADQISFVHCQLTKHLCIRNWRNAFYMSLAFNKVAVPFNDTLLYKRAFTALKENGKNNKKARELHQKTLLAKTISRMFLFAKQMQKVKNLKNQI